MHPRRGQMIRNNLRPTPCGCQIERHNRSSKSNPSSQHFYNAGSWNPSKETFSDGVTEATQCCVAFVPTTVSSFHSPLPFPYWLRQRNKTNVPRFFKKVTNFSIIFFLMLKSVPFTCKLPVCLYMNMANNKGYI